VRTPSSTRPKNSHNRRDPALRPWLEHRGPSQRTQNQGVSFQTHASTTWRRLHQRCGRNGSWRVRLDCRRSRTDPLPAQDRIGKSKSCSVQPADKSATSSHSTTSRDGATWSMLAQCGFVFQDQLDCSFPTMLRVIADRTRAVSSTGAGFAALR